MGKSQVAEAMWITTMSRQNRLEICRKHVQVAAGLRSNEALDVLCDIGSGCCGDWGMLEANLKRLVV